MTYEDPMDAIIHEALQGDEKPSADFTEKVMEQIAHTPQKQAVPRKKIIVSAAACAAVLVVALPILRLSALRMGKSAAADCDAACVTDECVAEDSAAAAESPAGAPAAPTVDESLTVFNSTADGGVSYDSEMGKQKAAGEAQKSLKATHRAAITIDPELCGNVRAWLEENGFPPAAEEQQIEFDLTSEQTAALQQAFPDLVLPDDACTVFLGG